MEAKVFEAPTDEALPFLQDTVDKDHVKNEAQKVLKNLLDDTEIVIKNINIEYFHYKPNSSCRLTYRFFLESGEEVMACGEAVAIHSKEKSKEGRWYRFIPSLNMYLRLLQSDNVLTGLKQIMNVKWIIENLHFFLPKEESESWEIKKKKIKVLVINYRPKTRCLLRIDIKLIKKNQKKKLTFYAKVYKSLPSPQHIHAINEIYRLTKSASFIIPSITGVSKENKTLFFKSRSGYPFLDAIRNEAGKNIINQLAYGLRSIHKCPAKLDGRVDLMDMLNEAENSAASLSLLGTELGKISKGIYNLLNANVFKIKHLAVAIIHGDFSHEQILVNDKRTVLLDFDRLKLGDFREDLANFTANMLETSISGKISEKEAFKVCNLFLKVYVSLIPGQLGVEALRWYTSFCLLKLAIRPLRRVESEWKERSKKILTFAKRIIDEECDDLFLDITAKNPEPEQFSIATIIEQIEKAKEDSLTSSSTNKDTILLEKIWPASNGKWLFLFQEKKHQKQKPNHYRKILPDGKIKYYTFPKDNILKELPHALDKDVIQKHLRNQIPASHAFSNYHTVDKINIINYKPEHRCQIEYLVKTGPDDSVIVKLYGKLHRNIDGAQSSYEVINYFRQSIAEADRNIFKAYPEPFLIPELNTVFLPEISGRSFYSILPDNPHKKMIENIAIALRTFHQSKYIPRKVHLWENEIKVLDKWTSAAKNLHPAQYSSLARLYEELLKKGNDINSSAGSPVHGDFYDKQILVQNNAVAFIDFDSIALGDPAIDIGNFLAHLTLRGIQQKGDSGHYDWIKKCFLSGYINTDEANLIKRIELYLLSSLLRLSCVYMLRPKGKALIYPILKEAEKVLQQGMEPLI